MINVTSKEVIQTTDSHMWTPFFVCVVCLFDTLPV